MHIETNSLYPVVNERNKRIHVPTSVGEVAIYHGHATAVAPAKRGTNQYLQERAALTASLAPPAAPPTVSWSVRAGGDSEKRPAIYAICSSANCAVRFRYEGKPEFADSVVFLHSCGPHAPAKIPSDVAELYRVTFKNNPLVNYSEDEAAVIGYAATPNKDSGHREVNRGKPMLDKNGQLYKLFFERK